MNKAMYLTLAALSLLSCSRNTSPNVYDSQTVGEAQATYQGTIVEMHKVTVTNENGLQDNTTGILGGGLAGALLGSTIGRGEGSVVATVAGGILGATGGAGLEQKLKTDKAIQYLVKLDNGELKTIVQAKEPRLHVGQAVYVMIGHQGRSRITAR